jgi:hypothetical protein
MVNSLPKTAWEGDDEPEDTLPRTGYADEGIS